MAGRQLIWFVLAASLVVFECQGLSQVQMPELLDDDLQDQVRDLKRNVSELQTYVQDLKNAVSQHLTHLRLHQAALESSVHRLEHLHEGSLGNPPSDSHHHSGEQHYHGSDHSHSGENTSHGSDHSHSGEHTSHGSDHSHSGEYHSHGSDHSHSGEHYSHGSVHSHSGEHTSIGSDHSHSGEHGHQSESHSHSYASHHHHSIEGSQGGDDHHHHRDSHEVEDVSQVAASDPDGPPQPVVERSGGMDLMNGLSFHGHSHHDRRRINRTVEIPKYADYHMYDFAVCEVRPNPTLPQEERQDVRGQVTFWQRKSGGPLNLHVRLQGFGQQVEADEQADHIHHRHGFHVHAFGDLSDGCQSTGPHYNPKGVQHGSPSALVRHVGDLGNIECDEHGVTDVVFSDDVASLKGQYSILGKGVVIHATEDDMGLGGDAESLKTGNAGARLACCVIQRVEKLAIRHYKSIKLAAQRPSPRA